MESTATGVYPTVRYGGSLTVKSSAYRYLAEHVDPQSKLLVFLWGNFGPEREPHWLVSVSRRSSLPRNATDTGHVGELVNGVSFLVVQREHLSKLAGCTLVCEAGVLILR